MSYYQVEANKYFVHPVHAQLDLFDKKIIELLEETKETKKYPFQIDSLSDELKQILTDFKETTLEVDTLYTMQRVMKNYEELNILLVEIIQKSNQSLQDLIKFED